MLKFIFSIHFNTRNMKNGEIIWFVELQNVAVFNLHENVIVEWNQNIIEDTKLIRFLNEMRTSKIPIFYEFFLY